MFENFRKTKSYIIGGKIFSFAVPLLFLIFQWVRTRNGFGAFFAMIGVGIPALALFILGYIVMVVNGINQAAEKEELENYTNIISDIGFIAASILIILYIIFIVAGSIMSPILGK